MAKKPIVIDLEAEKAAPSKATAKKPTSSKATVSKAPRSAPPAPDKAPPVPEIGAEAQPLPEGQAMQAAVALATRKPSFLARLFWSLVGLLVSVMISVAVLNFIDRLLTRMPILGYVVMGLVALFVVVFLIIALRELAAFSRLKRLDGLHHDANSALADNDLAKAKSVVKRLDAMYRHREEARLGREKLREYGAEQFDAEALLGLAETELLAPFDAAAEREVQAAARQVATVTALVPLALADVVAALTANVRMIRRVAEIYGGRSGVLGSWRLTRAVMTHLVATGVVAIGDDMLEPLIGGGILKKLSRRFGEGLVNGALSARVGIAAIEVCRPLPFHRAKQPSVSKIIRQSLSGLFSQK